MSLNAPLYQLLKILKTHRCISYVVQKQKAAKRQRHEAALHSNMGEAVHLLTRLVLCFGLRSGPEGLQSPYVCWRGRCEEVDMWHTPKGRTTVFSKGNWKKKCFEGHCLAF